jgi:alpha-L-fucosidase
METKVQKRKLGNSDLEVSELGIGFVPFSQRGKSFQTMNIFLHKSILVLSFLLPVFNSAHCQKKTLARPSEVQYRWHEQERIMFVCLDPCTWQGREYDNHSISLTRINPSKLNTDQWCEAAIAWGAKEILYVAKHTGGFCWWNTMTSDYGIRNTPWKDGKGDVVKELSESCRKYGLNLGIYVYPGDDTWGAGIGSGGKTADPTKQMAYNQVFRQQLTEVLSNYGHITEVWFDGSCVIEISDILDKYASESAIFQGNKATLRWPGTESGKLFYPAWNSLKSEILKTGISTQYDDDPDGDAWAPLEADVTLYNHNWFWSAANEKKRRSLDELMDIYYKSVGYGGVLLLNSTPDTTGLIPAEDIILYKELGKNIDRRFRNPLASLKDTSGIYFEIPLNKISGINHIVLKEDYRYGHRIREYVIEGLSGSVWKVLAKGSSVGRMKIDPFPSMAVSKVRLKITKYADLPLIRSFAVYNVENYIFNPDSFKSIEWQLCETWDTKSFINGKGNLTVDLSKFIMKPGQYEVTFTSSVVITGMHVEKAGIYFDNDMLTQQDFIQRKGETNTFFINRTAQVAQGSTTILKVEMTSDNSVFQNKGEILIRDRSQVKE